MTRNCCNDLILDLETRGFGGFTSYENKKNHECQNAIQTTFSFFDVSREFSKNVVPAHLFDKTWVFHPVDVVWSYIKQYDLGHEGVFLLHLRETNDFRLEKEFDWQKQWVADWANSC